MQPVVLTALHSQRYTVVLDTPDCPHIVPRTDKESGGTQLRVTRIACTWEVSATGVTYRNFDISGPRVLKSGADGRLIEAWWWSSRETPQWLADIVTPYTPDWYNASVTA